MEEELKKMYDSEINIRIQSFWDADWSVFIMVGDKWVGSEEFDVCNLDEIIPTLQDLIKKHLPNSKYAKELLTNNPLIEESAS